MIKASELRIGNWVNFTNSNGYNMFIRIDIYLLGYIFEANPEYMQHGYGIHYREDSIRGISLTPQILEQCGFEKDENLTRVKKDKRIVLLLDISEINQLVYVFKGYQQGTKLEYLHQLQNLYFALTGQELEINITHSQLHFSE